MVPKHLEHYARLNVEARSDIEKWWAQYSRIWNSISMMHLLNVALPAAMLTSDASGSWGCGAYSGTNWFMLPWSDLIANYITVKELIPIVIAGVMRGSLSHVATALAQWDSTAVVNHGSSKNQDAMHLTRCLAFITAKFDFHIIAINIKRALNIRADALYHNNLSLFRSLLPQANKERAPVPQ